jgi:pyruvate carboxylase subunit B
MKYFVTLRGQTWTVTVEGDAVTVEGSHYRAELRQTGDSPLRMLLLDGHSFALPALAEGRGQWKLQAQGEWFSLEVLDERRAHIRSLVGQGARAEGPPVLKAPMPGLVIRVLVQPGQQVADGASLLVLEAMKMENDLKARGAGRVEAVLVTPGQAVEKGQELIRFGAPGAG